MTLPRSPELPSALTAHTGSLELSDGLKIERVALDKTPFTGSVSRDLTFEECRLTEIELTTRVIKQLAVVDTVIERSRVFGLSADGSLWRRAQLRHTQAVGLVVSASTLEDVLIEDTKLDHANFRVAKLRRVILRRCSLREVDFSGTTMSNVWFDDCELDQASFDRVTASDVSLVGSRLGRLNGLAGLKGATISSQQLFKLSPQLAGELGLKVET